jgi:altronate hydrolase
MATQNVDFFSSPTGVVPLQNVAIRLHNDDSVVIAKVPLQPGTVLDAGSSRIPLHQFVPSGHKIATEPIQKGAPLRRYGQVIGFATQDIALGDHVHTHNLAVQDFARDYNFGVDVKAVDFVPENERRTFMGYKRADGRVGTRNYVAVISTVNCSAHTTRQIARHFTEEMLADYPNVDGVISIAHQSGCAVQIGGADYLLLQRTLAGMARNVNIAAYILVGLGCETNQISDLVANYALVNGNSNHLPPSLTLQTEGGIRKTTEAGIAAIKELLLVVNAVQRTSQPISELVVALQCGGSDGWSGVSANPVLGLAVDEIVRQGGTAVLAETPEIYGAEHLLTRRAINREVGEKLIDKVHWWEDHTKKLNIEIDNNPSVGNKVGGLTTIYEKSLGAVAKGGNTPLMGVYDYSEPVTARGFTFMDTPGYDPVGATGQVAGGCNLIVFTTGRGSCFGYKPAPSIKVASNTTMYNTMVEDMDLNAGKVIDGVPMEEVAGEMLDLIISIASGQKSKSEAQGVGEDEFIPWNLGGTL